MGPAPSPAPFHGKKLTGTAKSPSPRRRWAENVSSCRWENLWLVDELNKRAQPCTGSGAKAGGLDQTHLVATGSEFTTLIALHYHTTARLHADHPGANPAKSGGFENLHHITGL